jgi:glutamate-1-semialdehyde aminotransferase
MAAGIAQLTYLKEHPEVYAHLDMLAEKLFSGMRR